MQSPIPRSGNDLQPNVAARRLRWEEERKRTQPHRACRKNQESQKMGDAKSFDAIEKLVRGQMWAKMFSTKSSHPFSRQAPSGLRRVELDTQGSRGGNPGLVVVTASRYLITA